MPSRLHPVHAALSALLLIGSPVAAEPPPAPPAQGAGAKTSPKPADPPGHAGGHGKGPAAGHGPAVDTGGHHHAHGGMPHRFEKAADWVQRFEGPEREAWQKPAQIVAALGDITGKTVVDLGAGTGYFLPYLSRAVGDKGKVLAVDIEADMVRHMKERAVREGLKNVEARQSTADDPALEPSSADRVLIVDVWHHVPQRPAFAKKLAAALRPLGALFIVDFKLDSPRGPPRKHKLGPEQIMADLKAAGLFAELAKVDLPDQYVVTARIATKPASPQ